jgi:hypothetical protein
MNFRSRDLFSKKAFEHIFFGQMTLCPTIFRSNGTFSKQGSVKRPHIIIFLSFGETEFGQMTIRSNKRQVKLTTTMKTVFKFL